MTFYGFMARVLLPTALWGRLDLDGAEVLPEEGPVLVVPNHDSQWDPVMLAVALRRRRQLRFLARAELWRMFGLKPILNGLRQIPIERGAGDSGALDAAVACLRAGEAVCIFPEGRLSQGEELRARSGTTRLAEWVPEAQIVCAAITGTTGFVMFPRRPRVRIELFATDVRTAPELLAQLRAKAPPVPVKRASQRARSRRPARAARPGSA